VKIRLKRLGRRNRSFFRVCAFDGRTRRDGRSIEDLGFYDPFASDPEKAVSLNKERLEYWLKVGAQPSDTVVSLLKGQGVPIPGRTATQPAKA